MFQHSCAIFRVRTEPCHNVRVVILQLYSIQIVHLVGNNTECLSANCQHTLFCKGSLRNGVQILISVYELGTKIMSG
jgi:hypothetical protein